MAGKQSSISPSIPCNLCGGSEVEVIGNKGRDGKPLQSVICLDCGLVWTDPRPGTEQMKQFYTDKYRVEYKAVVQPKLKHAYRETKRAIQRFERIRPLLVDGMKVLDVGAGGGFFPYVLKHRGYAVEGIEPNLGFAGYANQQLEVDTHTGFVQDFAYAEGSFDIITLNHVLEHLEDPGAVLKRLFNWNRPGGYLNVEVPNIEATYHAPGHKFHRAHLYTFNPENLKLLGRKAGYQIYDLQLMAGTLHINVIFQKPAAPGPEPELTELRIRGNYSGINRVLISHTPWRHYLSGKVYRRFFRKNLGYLKEILVVRRYSSGRTIADYLISRHRD